MKTKTTSKMRTALKWREPQKSRYPQKWRYAQKEEYLSNVDGDFRLKVVVFGAKNLLTLGFSGDEFFCTKHFYTFSKCNN